MSWTDIHKRVIDTDDKDLAGVGELGVADVAGHMLLRARGGEGGRHADDNALVDAAAVLFRQAHLVGRRALVQLDVRDGVADLHKDARRAVERTRRCHWARDGGGHSTESTECHCCDESESI